MVRKPTFILLIVMVALGLLAWWFELSPSVTTAKTTPTITQSPRPFSSWKFENTTLIEYLDPGGNNLTIRKGKDFNTWSVDQLKDTLIDSGKVTRLLAELFSIQPLMKLGTAPDVSAMGLGENTRRLTLSDTSGSTIEIVFGAESPTKSGTYVQIGTDYYIINTPVINNIDPLVTKEGLIAKTEFPQQNLPTQTP